MVGNAMFRERERRGLRIMLIDRDVMVHARRKEGEGKNSKKQ